MMSSDYSFRINDRLYEINGEPISSTLGDFLQFNTITFSSEFERSGTIGTLLFIAEHDHYGEPIYRFVSPYLVNLVKLADRDLVAVDLLHDEESRENVVLSHNELSKKSISEESLIAKLTACIKHESHSLATTLEALLDAKKMKFAGAERLIQKRPYFTETLTSKVIILNEGMIFYVPTTITEAIKIKTLNRNARYVYGGNVLEKTSDSKNGKYISLASIPELREIESTDKFWVAGSSISLRSFFQYFFCDEASIKGMLLEVTSLHFINSHSIRDVLYSDLQFTQFAEILVFLSAELVFRSLEDEITIVVNDIASLKEFIECTHEGLLISINVPKKQNHIEFGVNNNALKEGKKEIFGFDVLLNCEDRIIERLLIG